LFVFKTRSVLKFVQFEFCFVSYFVRILNQSRLRLDYCHVHERENNDKLNGPGPWDVRWSGAPVRSRLKPLVGAPVSCWIPALAALLSSCTWPASLSSASFFFLARCFRTAAMTEARLMIGFLEDERCTARHMKKIFSVPSRP
jgi:hypothetical protein